MDDKFLTPEEVADIFKVDAKTVTRWASAGKFPKGVVIKTPGGHWRFRRSGVVALVSGRND